MEENENKKKQTSNNKRKAQGFGGVILTILGAVIFGGIKAAGNKGNNQG